MTQADDAVGRPEAKVFIISAIVLSTSVTSAAFWYGVFGTIFFTHLLYVWAAATAALLVSFFVPRIDARAVKLPWRGRFLMALPTVWLVLSAFVDVEAYRPDSLGSLLLLVLTLASAFLTLPYLLYVVIAAVVPDIDRLTNTTLRVALVCILVFMTAAGFVIGKNHRLFLTCENFKVGGHDIPRNCRKVGESPL